MIFEVWQTSESMKILLKNDAKCGTGSDIRFLSILDGFWIDFGRVFGSFWRSEGIKSQEKIRKGFEDALGGVKGGLVEAFGSPWRLWGSILDAKREWTRRDTDSPAECAGCLFF